MNICWYMCVVYKLVMIKMQNKIKNYLKEIKEGKKNITVVKIYLWQANICRCICSGLLKQLDYMYITSQKVIKYLCKHWIGSSELGQFSLLLSCQPYGLNLKGTQLCSYWFLKRLKVNCWHFSVRGQVDKLLNKCRYKTASLCSEVLGSVFYCLLLKHIELATFFECQYFQLAKLNFNSHFASLQA